LIDRYSDVAPPTATLSSSSIVVSIDAITRLGVINAELATPAAIRIASDYNRASIKRSSILTPLLIPSH
jgi:hypothetical protein